MNREPLCEQARALVEQRLSHEYMPDAIWIQRAIPILEAVAESPIVSIENRHVFIHPPDGGAR